MQVLQNSQVSHVKQCLLPRKYRNNSINLCIARTQQTSGDALSDLDIGCAEGYIDILGIFNDYQIYPSLSDICDIIYCLILHVLSFLHIRETFSVTIRRLDMR